MQPSRSSAIAKTFKFDEKMWTRYFTFANQIDLDHCLFPFEENFENHQTMSIWNYITILTLVILKYYIMITIYLTDKGLVMSVAKELSLKKRNLLALVNDKTEIL